MTAYNKEVKMIRHLKEKGWRMLWGAGLKPFYWHEKHTAPHKRYMTLEEAYGHQIAFDKYESQGVVRVVKR